MPFLTTFYGNPSSLHRHGRAVKTAIEQAREQVARLVNANAEQVIFTSGGTESNNLACLMAADKKNVFIGATEHPSVIEALRALKIIPVDPSGLIKSDSLPLENGFVSIMYANNETGVVQNIRQLTHALAGKDVIFHTDAVQAAGKIPLDFALSGSNLMSLSAHKMYGPKGTGALIHDGKTNLNPIFKGGSQESGYRAGTENIAGIVGFGKAAELAMLELDLRREHLLMLQSTLEEGLEKITGLSIVAQAAQRLRNTSQIVIENIDGEMLLMQLDQQSIAVSSGSACSSNSKEPSPVLKAMGYEDKLALSAIRISLGQQNTLEEVERFIEVLRTIAGAR